MNKTGWLAIIFTIMLSTLSLTGCGSGITQEEYDAVTAERDALKTEKAALQNQNQSLQSELTTITANLTILQNEYDNLQEDYEEIQSGQDDLQEQLDEANAALDEILGIYPPGDFVSETELLLWLEQNDVSEAPPAETVQDWVNKALAIQLDALADGYIINMDYDYDAATETYTIYCTTIFNGSVYYWDPETDDVTRDSSL